jgi:hypothetical protein
MLPAALPGRKDTLRLAPLSELFMRCGDGRGRHVMEGSSQYAQNVRLLRLLVRMFGLDHVSACRPRGISLG